MIEKLRKLLDKVLLTHSPGGWEGEMDEIIKDEIKKTGLKYSQDDRGNITINIPGLKEGPKTVISAHKDEISLMIKDISEDGKIYVEPVGGIRPIKYGEGPFDVIGEENIIPGILCIGSAHVSELSARVHKTKTGLTTWEDVYIDCKLDKDGLNEKGIDIGDMACVARSRKTPMYLNDSYVAAYALDDKGAVAILLILAGLLVEEKPLYETVLAFTSEEENGVSGFKYLARRLNPDRVIAVEIAPVAEEYPIEMGEKPVILMKDGLHSYSKGLSRSLINKGKAAGIECQKAVIRTFGSEGSTSSKEGLSAQSACLCFATENTHGYEISDLRGMVNCVRLLFNFLRSG